ncbi:IclR family transcriptional regulator [Herbiconiux ginsengi]|uniref:Glycerol operon regulatory protein n=1 Tax=Herbiconiux ginsengi TaxID=381665 RepID=A0A1H3MRV3_9MICO|nr:helix-turn-helix domain-containing protein [Herbiconiux ginsengi]SDY79210.1 transcriptional regulator, IclR family [Herbiconiux ginsengi]
MDDARHVKSVERALDILMAFNARNPRLQLQELAESAGIPKSSARRLALTLISAGFLEQSADGTYCLGGRLLELGGVVANAGALSELTARTMREIHEASGESVLVADVNWIDRSILITHKRDAVHLLSISSPVGKRTALGTGCITKAALAALPAAEAERVVAHMAFARKTPRSVASASELLGQLEVIRAQGWASEEGEFIDGVSGVAVAVVENERPIGAVAVIAPSSRAPRSSLETWGALMSASLGRGVT